MYKDVKLVVDEYRLQDLEKRATHCPDAESLYCTGNKVSAGYIPYKDGFALAVETGAAFFHCKIGAPVHADGDTAKSAARRYNNDPAPIAGGLN